MTNFAAIRKFYEDGGYVKPRKPTDAEAKKMALYASQHYAKGGKVTEFEKKGAALFASQNFADGGDVKVDNLKLLQGILDATPSPGMPQQPQQQAQQRPQIPPAPQIGRYGLPLIPVSAPPPQMPQGPPQNDVSRETNGFSPFGYADGGEVETPLEQAEEDSRVELLADAVEKQSRTIDKLVKVITKQTEVLAAPQEIIRDSNNRITQVKRKKT